MSTTPAGPPLIGALLRMPVDVVYRRMLQRLHERGFTDLVPAHFAVLRYPGPIGQRPVELASEAGVSKQAINYLLGQLEERGYVERRADPDDVRSKRVYLTARGDEIRTIIRAAVQELEAEWAEALGERDLERLRRLLTRLNAAVEKPS